MLMEEKELDNKLKEFIVKCSPCKKDIEIHCDTNLQKDAGYTSIELIQLIVEIENYFDIEISAEYVEMNLYQYDNLKNTVMTLIDR